MVDAVMQALIAHHDNDEVARDFAVNHMLFIPRQGWIVTYVLFHASVETHQCAFVSSEVNSHVVWSHPIVK